MAEAAAAFYTIETILEGVALGGLAVTRSTAPLRLRFRKVPAPGPELHVKDHALTASGIKIYVCGGNRQHSVSNTEQIDVLSLPSSLGPLEDYVEPLDLDYQSVTPSFATPILSETDSTMDRSGHAAVEIDDNVYFLGGQSHQTNHPPLTFEYVPVLNLSTRSLSLLLSDTTTSTAGIPEPRLNPSCTSSAILNTIFIHGGISSSNLSLSDSWALYIPTKTWTRLPDLTSSTVTSIAFTESDGKLWALNNHTGQVSHLEVIMPEQKDEKQQNTPADLLVSKPSLLVKGEWQTAYAPTQDSQDSVAELKPSSTTSVNAPASVLPITTGAGRRYLLFIPPELRTSPDQQSQSKSSSPSADHRTNIMAFQLPSQHATLASIKDAIRHTLPMKGSSSGTFEWSRCRIIDATMQDGPLEVPDVLSGWAAALVGLSKNTVMLWGGCRGGNQVWEDGGWLMSAE